MSDGRDGGLAIGGRHAHTSCRTAPVEGRGRDVIVPFQIEKREGFKDPGDSSERGVRAERLENLLEDQSRQDDVLIRGVTVPPCSRNPNPTVSSRTGPGCDGAFGGPRTRPGLS